ncbi:DUF6777 domain-containing protein [Streptomyces sp. NPDC096351]|uniref:DUF6777 domain-containing protein n=1 Tax=Streptomyces sp. NPDC096351 TaxID=3366087 RepID=UPI00380F0750
MGPERKKGKKVTSHPPSGPPSVPPAGPPSGPLSGPGARPGSGGHPPPPGPPPGGPGGGGSSGGRPGGPSGGSGGGSGSGGTGGPGGSGNGGPGKAPWWRSVPKVASVTAVVVAAVALVVVLTNSPDDKNDTAGSGGGEVFLQNAAATGPDPFTKSTARTDTASASPASLPPRTSSATTEVSGSTPGLYGGTRSVASCDVEQQVRYLSAEPAKNAAFASTLGIQANQVPGYLRSLTPLQLRADTRVTNHGYRDGAATTYQSVLQAGTAVLVDDRGVPRVRCACGNPLTPPVAQKSPRTTGTPWQGYNADQVVVVAPSVTVVNVFVVYDVRDDSWFARQQGDHRGRKDKPTEPPRPPSTSPSTSASTSPSVSPSSPVPCVTVTGDETPAPVDGVTPSPCPETLSPSVSTSAPTSPSDTPPSSDTPPPSEDTTPPDDTSPSADSPAPQSAPVTESSAGLSSASTGSSAAGSPPAPPGADSAPAPAPGPQAAPRSATGSGTPSAA